jgi:uncharacterized membrane protein YkvA (DUF1232 family)
MEAAVSPSKLETSDEEFVKQGASKVTDKDLEKVVSKSDEIQKKFQARGPLARFLEDGRLLIALVRDYWSRNYRRVPFGIIGAAAFTLMYVLNPLDLLPDVLPIIGQLDDATVVGACLLLIEQDLLVYQKWRQGRSNIQ